MKEMHDLEDIRNTSDEIRTFQKVNGNVVKNYGSEAHPDGCTCGHCSQDHSHEGHVHAHSHGEANHAHSHSHDHDCKGEHDETCCCGNAHGHTHEHSHSHEEACGCGHDHGHTHEHSHSHEEACGCGHDHGHTHEHSHSHEEACGCGHDHGHTHEHSHSHEEACGCGHDHGHTHEHSHSHEEACGCGHDHGHTHEHSHSHEEACGCGHDHGHTHEHSHSHEEACGCGHDHGHSHDHVSEGEACYPHEDYCDVCGESLENCTCKMPDADKVKKVYILKNLGCANCAAKMEYKIKELPGVTYANISFTTKQLRLSAKNHEVLLPQIRDICKSIESDVEVVPRDKREKSVAAESTRVYIVKGLDCANCGAKIETALNQMPEINECVLTFTTKKMRVSATNYDGLLAKMQTVVDKVEEGVLLEEVGAGVVLDPELDDRKKSGGILSKVREKQSLLEIVIGGLIFIVTEWLGLIPEAYHIYCLVIAYIILGWNIVLTAVKNLFKGQVFDENFLMTVATLGAFGVKAWEEAVGVIFFYRVGEYFEQQAVEKSRGQIMTAVDMRPEVVNLLVGENVKVIPAEDANVGDILLVRVGDRIPLDSVVVEGESLVDTSPITGEPVPVKKKYGDEVVSGCVNTSGMLKVRVEKLLEESMVTKILDSVENAAASKPAIDKFITRFARIYTPVVVFLSIITAFVLPFVYQAFGNPDSYMTILLGGGHHGEHGTLYSALTFLVISCPCALVLSVPLAFFSGIGAGSKYGILFKGGVAMEALKNVQAIVMDKTGTITEGNFIVQKIVPAVNVEEDDVLSTCAGAEQVSTHPIAVSIVSVAEEKRLDLIRPNKFEEIAGEGLVAYNGETVVLCGNMKLMKRYGIDTTNYVEASYGSEVLVARNGKYLGQILINDTLKEDAKEAITSLKKMGLVTAMLTGDKEKEAQAVAAEAGVDEVRAKLLPQDKLTELNNLRNKYGPVMFVGDGINDAPVLAGADIGAAMGSGADAAIEAADVVFMNSEVKCIPQAIAIACKTGEIAWQNVVFALAVKVIIMIAGMFGYASMWAAIFADTGVSLLCVLNSIRILYKNYKE